MGGCVSQTQKPAKNPNAPVAQKVQTETLAQVETRHKKLTDALDKSAENQKTLDERILSTADSLVRMPEYLERLMTSKIEEKKEIVKGKQEEVQIKVAEQKEEVVAAVEAKKAEVSATAADMTAKKDEKLAEVKQEAQAAVDSAKKAIDEKKESAVVAGAPEETKQSAINDEFKHPETQQDVQADAAPADNQLKQEQPAAAQAAPAASTEAKPQDDKKAVSQVKEDTKNQSQTGQIQTESKPAGATTVQQPPAQPVQESEYDKNLRVLRAGLAHKKQVEAFRKALDEEVKACDAYVKGLTDADKKEPLKVADRFKKADKLIACYESNSVAKFEGIYKNQDLKCLVKDLCCCYFDAPSETAINHLIKTASEEADKLLEERYTLYLEEEEAVNAPSGLEQFASRNQDHFDEIKKSWAEGSSPMKDSIAKHSAELAQINAEWKEEMSPVRERMEEFQDKLENAVQSMMVKLKDIELPSNPRGDDEVYAESSSDEEEGAGVGSLERKDGPAKNQQPATAQDTQKQAVVIDAEEASRQANVEGNEAAAIA